MFFFSWVGGAGGDAPSIADGGGAGGLGKKSRSS